MGVSRDAAGKATIRCEARGMGDVWADDFLMKVQQERGYKGRLVLGYVDKGIEDDWDEGTAWLGRDGGKR